MDEIYVNKELIQTKNRRSEEAPYRLEFSKRDVLIKQGESTIIIDEELSRYATLDSTNVEDTIRRLQKGNVYAKILRVMMLMAIVSLIFYTILIYKYISA